jgi:putative protein kinase ArgK-like GTPase of G3E family
MLVLEAAGYDVIIVETVGVGQNEIAVSEMVDTFLLLTLARAGDQLQGIKRGILELADVIAVNKADGDGEGPARVAARELAGAMRSDDARCCPRRPPVLTCSALTGAGLDEVWEAVLEHRAHLERGIAGGAARAAAAGLDVGWMWAHGRRPARSMAAPESSSSSRNLPQHEEEDRNRRLLLCGNGPPHGPHKTRLKKAKGNPHPGGHHSFPFHC